MDSEKTECMTPKSVWLVKFRSASQIDLRDEGVLSYESTSRSAKKRNRFGETCSVVARGTTMSTAMWLPEAARCRPTWRRSCWGEAAVEEAEVPMEVCGGGGGGGGAATKVEGLRIDG
jgi:hypothetical protein